MPRLRNILVITLGAVIASSSVAPAVPSQSDIDAISAAAAQARAQQGTSAARANAAWQRVINMVDDKYPIGTKNAIGEPTYDPGVSSDGQARPDNGTVQIGPSGMRSGGNTAPANSPFSPGWLAGVKLHEFTHIDQFASGTWTNDPANRSYHEILAYEPEITRSKELGLTKKERDEFLRRAKADLVWLKTHIRHQIGTDWEKIKDGGNTDLADEYVKLFRKIDQVIDLEKNGQEVAAMHHKLEIKKEIEEQKPKASGDDLKKLEDLEKKIKMLIKAEELIEKFALTNHIRDAEDETKGTQSEAIGILTTYVKNMIKAELADDLETALKYKKQLLEKLKRARAGAAASGSSQSAQDSLRKAEDELEKLIKKEEMQLPPPPPPTPAPPRIPVPPPKATPTPPPPQPPTPVPTPRPEPTPDPEQPETPGGTKLPGDTRHEPPTGPDYYHRGAATISFTALVGETVVNEKFVGDKVESVNVSPGEPGAEVPPGTVSVRRKGGTYVLNVAPGFDINSIVIKGTTGLVNLFRDNPAPAPDLSLLWPLDGTVEIKNGMITETFRTQPGTIPAGGSPHDYITMIEGEPTPVIALRPDEIALNGQNVPRPLDGTSDIVTTMPDGTLLVDTVPAWSFRVAAQPAAKVNTWAPIYLECVGLPTDDLVRVEFTPGPGQMIEPLKLEVPCGPTGGFQEIARYTASQVGPQQFLVTVTRVK